MAKLTVTLTRLEEWKDGMVYGTDVTFKAIQSGVVLIEDNVSGKCTAPYPIVKPAYSITMGTTF